jgi:hypothetical protein
MGAPLASFNRGAYGDSGVPAELLATAASKR